MDELRSMRAAEMPTGTVTFLFTDIEGSTRCCERDAEATQVALALHCLGLVAEETGNYAPAEVQLQESLALFRELGDRSGTAWALHHLGLVAHGGRDHERAMAHFKESLALRRDLDDKIGLAERLEGLAGVAGAAGQPEQAARLYGAAATLRDATRAPLSPLDRAGYERDLDDVQARLAPEAFAALWAQGQTMPLEWAVSDASELNALA